MGIRGVAIEKCTELVETLSSESSASLASSASSQHGLIHLQLPLPRQFLLLARLGVVDFVEEFDEFAGGVPPRLESDVLQPGLDQVYPVLEHGVRRSEFPVALRDVRGCVVRAHP